MNLKSYYKGDIKFLLSKKNHLGDDFWTTNDNRIGKGSPFSVRDVGIMLADLGFKKNDPLIKGIAERIFQTQREDGRFKITPSGSIFVCHTVTAARVLCSLGLSKDKRLTKTYDHLLEIQHEDGGWRCAKVKMGKGFDMDMSNPGVTLEALDVFRFTKHINSKTLNPAVEFLLKHWELKRPLGPCHFGIGTLFMQTEFPFLRYNLFYYCHTLSFYKKAIKDKRFKLAVSELDKKTSNGKIVVENPNRSLRNLTFCKKGEISELATLKYVEMKERLKV